MITLTNATEEAELKAARFEEECIKWTDIGDRHDEQLKTIQKKIQAMEGSFDSCTEQLFEVSLKLEEKEKAYNLSSDTSLWLDTPINTNKLEHEGLQQLLSIPRFSNIVKLDLSNLKLDKKQLKELLTTVRDTGPLEDLNFTQCLNLAEVPAFLIAQSASRLTRVNFSQTCLTTQQCTALLSNSLHSSTLQDVNLSHINLSQVDSPLLSSAVSRFRRVDLSFTKLSPDQTQLLLASIPSSPITD